MTTRWRRTKIANEKDDSFVAAMEHASGQKMICGREHQSKQRQIGRCT